MSGRPSSELPERPLSSTASTASPLAQEQVDQGDMDVQQRLLEVGSDSSSVGGITSPKLSIEKEQTDMESRRNRNEDDGSLPAEEYELRDDGFANGRRQMGSLSGFGEDLYFLDYIADFPLFR